MADLATNHTAISLAGPTSFYTTSFQEIIGLCSISFSNPFFFLGGGGGGYMFLLLLGLGFVQNGVERPPSSLISRALIVVIYYSHLSDNSPVICDSFTGLKSTRLLHQCVNMVPWGQSVCYLLSTLCCWRKAEHSLYGVTMSLISSSESCSINKASGAFALLGLSSEFR